MSGDPTRVASAEPCTTPLATVSALVWFAAALSATALGMWTALGAAAVALGLAIFLLDRRASIAHLRPSPGLALLGVATAALMATATYLLHPALVELWPPIATDTAKLYAAFRAPSPAVAAAVLLPVVVGEELVWRGVVQGALARRYGRWAGVALAASAYALVQAPIGSAVLVAAALACGLVWGALRAVTGSLVPTLVAHLLWNIVVLLWLPLDSR
jgi:membrane protease YdiL (CAAX protease family)